MHAKFVALALALNIGVAGGVATSWQQPQPPPSLPEVVVTAQRLPPAPVTHAVTPKPHKKLMPWEQGSCPEDRRENAISAACPSSEAYKRGGIGD
jgi:hypothetical protein